MKLSVPASTPQRSGLGNPTGPGHELFVPVVTAWVMGAILRPIAKTGRETWGAPSSTRC